MSNILSNPIFGDETAAREWLEKRLWKNGPICPHCGVVDDATLMQGKSHRPGLYQCNSCREPFSVTVGTLYERSHIPLNKWLAATYLLMSSKKGVSALQVGRMVGVSKKTAWFLCHRIRESLREGTLGLPPLGGNGKIVEADETYYGRVDEPRPTRSSGQPFIKKGIGANKRPIVSLVERGGKVRSFHVARADKVTAEKIIKDNIAKETHLYTDESGLYKDTDTLVIDHATVKHSAKEYVRGEVHTNTVEGFFSIFKRGMTGVYQHCDERHLHRYLAEFDYRYNHREGLGFSDWERTEASFPGIVGKRLTYRRTHQAHV